MPLASPWPVHPPRAARAQCDRSTGRSRASLARSRPAVPRGHPCRPKIGGPVRSYHAGVACQSKQQRKRSMDVHGAGVATDHIARAHELAPLLIAAAPRIDAVRELPNDVLDAMHAKGMFRLLVPRSLGGAELDPATYIQCVEAIASGDASVAWCMNQGSGCSLSAAYLEPAAAREIFGGKRDVLAWGQGPGAKAIRIDGGWRVSGTWAFASGSRHATWLGAHCPCFEADGTPQRYLDGRTRERTML